MRPLLSIICPSLEHRLFVDQASLKRMRNLPVEFLRLSDNDWRSTGRKTVDLIHMARGEWIMGMGDDDILHPSFFALVLPKLQQVGPRQMVGYNVAVLPDTGGPDLLCRVHPKFGPFQPEAAVGPIGIQRWEGTTQFRPYAMTVPVRRRLFDGLELTERNNKSYGEDNQVMIHVIPQLDPARCLYLDRTMYYAMPLTQNPDRKLWNTKYDD
jgi:hypothetical protein